MLKQMLKKNNQKGFTLVELMVVVVIIGVLVAIAIPVYNNASATARTNAIQANVRILKGAVSMYKSSNSGTVTANATSNTQLVPNYIQEWPTGPAGVSYSVTADVVDFTDTATPGS